MKHLQDIIQESVFDDDLSDKLDREIVKSNEDKLNHLSVLFNPHSFSRKQNSDRKLISKILSKLQEIPSLFIVDNKIKWSGVDINKPSIKSITPKYKTDYYYILINNDESAIYIYDPNCKYNTAQTIIPTYFYSKLGFASHYSKFDNKNIISIMVSPLLNDWMKDIINKFEQ